jgi:predicted HTH domain antitoxin
MDKQIAIMYPESLASSLKMKSREFELEIKTLSLVKLYELGKISSSMAARILNIPRLEFLEILSDYGVSYFSTAEDEIESDYGNA